MRCFISTSNEQPDRTLILLIKNAFKSEEEPMLVA